MAVRGYILVILVANSLALWNSNSGVSDWNSPGLSRAVPTRCSQAGLSCSNCQESYFCNTATSTPLVIACLSNEVCGGPPGNAGCIDFTVDGASAGTCDCDTIGNSGFLVDPYDASRYFICIPSGQQFLATCDAGFVFSTETNGCVDEDDTATVPTPDCAVEGVGFHTTDPTCKTYHVCYRDNLPPLPFSCPDGQAYDESIPACVAECLLGPTAFACPASGSGAFPDTSDCTIFHICSNGDPFASDIQCPTGWLFDPTSMVCVTASTDVVCPVINDCWAEYCEACGGTCPVALPNTTVPIVDNPTSPPSTTVIPPVNTTVTTPPGGGSSNPPNCNNGTGYSAYTANCKQFWSCQDDDNGGYEAILYRCPGILYFIPSRSHCSIQSDLPAPPGCTIVP